MDLQRLSLTHMVRRPTVQQEGRPPFLLLLHGIGSYEGDLFSLAPKLDGRFFVMSARAPVALSAGAYAWFRVGHGPGGLDVDPEEAEQSRVMLIEFIDESVEAYYLDPGAVYLGGFSQGAIMSLALALTQPGKLAGVAAMSGLILPQILPFTAPPEALRDFPVLQTHGTADPVLPIEYARATRDFLSTFPLRLTYREYPSGHYLPAQGIADAGAWLEAQLDERVKKQG